MTPFSTDSQMAQTTNLFTEKITNIYIKAYMENLFSLKPREVFVLFLTQHAGTSCL